MTEELSRVGKKWLKEEDEELRNEILLNKSYDEIALNHKRNIGGIKSRVISHIIYPEYKDCEEIDYEYIAIKYNIDKDIIEKKLNNDINSKNRIKRIEELNNDISNKNRIKRIEDKLDKIMEYLKI